MRAGMEGAVVTTGTGGIIGTGIVIGKWEIEKIIDKAEVAVTGTPTTTVVIIR